MKFNKILYACSLISCSSCEVLQLPGYAIGKTVSGFSDLMPLTMANERFVYLIDGYKIAIKVPKYAATTKTTFADKKTFVSLNWTNWASHGVAPSDNGRSTINISYAMTSQSSIHYYKFRNFKFGEPMPDLIKIGKYDILVSPKKNWLEIEINKNLYLKIRFGGPENFDIMSDIKYVISDMKIEEIPGVAHQTLLPLAPDPRSLAVTECRKKAKSGASGDFLNLYYALLKSPDYFEQDEAINWLIKSAKSNNSQAQWELSLCHYKNIGSGEKSISKDMPDLNSAFHWMSRSAERNHPEAQLVLGTLLWRGEYQLPRLRGYLQLPTGCGTFVELSAQPKRPSDVPQNDKDAAIWLEKSAAAGNHKAITALMHFYAYSNAFRNRESVAKWQAQALASGLYDEVFEFLCLWGFSLGAGRDGYIVDNDAALKCLNDAELIRKNHKITLKTKSRLDSSIDTSPVATVMINIGKEFGPIHAYISGGEDYWIATKSLDKAVFWFHKSGEIGGAIYWESSASVYRGFKSNNDLGDNQRNILKEHFWTKAAEAGNADACAGLGDMYSDQKKYDLAMKWFLTGADYELKNPSSMGVCFKALGRAYEEGKITEKNIDKAKYWLRLYLKKDPDKFRR